MQLSGKRFLIIIGSIAVSAGALALILRDVPLDAVTESMEGASPAHLLLAFVFATLALVTRGIRWWVLLNYRLPLTQAGHMVNVMFLGNQLPMRMGEVARSVLAFRAGVPLVTSATSIIVERLVDTLVVALFVAATVSHLPNIPSQVTDSAALLGALGIVGFLVLLFLAQAPQFAHRVLDRLLDTIPLLNRLPLTSILSNLLDGLQPLTSIRTLTFTTFWTAAAWAMTLATSYVLHLALGIKVDFALSVPLGIALTAISIALPVSIASIGPFEAAIILTGQLVGMDPVEAVSLGLLLHGMMVLSYAIFGSLGLLALGISPAAAFAGKGATPEAER